MAHVVLLFAVCVLCSWEAQGSTAVTPVFVKNGTDLLLEVNEHVELSEETDFAWIFNQTSFVVKLSYDNKPVIIKNYSGRVEFSDQNHSLLLKNLQQADSGNYVAVVTGETDQNIAEYKVTVQNPVSPVQLSVDSVSNSTESCNLTVSCSTERSHISSTFRCDDQTCYQEGGEQSNVTSSGSSLRVYLLNDSIICNHSNQVNWTKDLNKTRLLCSTATDGGLTIGSWIGIIVGCLVVIFVFVLAFSKESLCGKLRSLGVSLGSRDGGQVNPVESHQAREDLSEEEKHNVASVSQAGSPGEREVSPNSADMEQVPVMS